MNKQPDEVLTIRIDPADRKKLRKLAEGFDGNASMTIRRMIREQYAELVAASQEQETEQAS